jgi:hypothetical protein
MWAWFALRRLSGSAIPDPQKKAAASRTVADWLAVQLDGDQPELQVRVNAFPICSPCAGCFAA